jgi:hypothetical protein
MEIVLSTPKEIVVMAERKKVITKVEIIEVVDVPKIKTVTAKTNEFGTVVLWKGADYDSIGQWTDTDVINKIKLIYNLG